MSAPLVVNTKDGTVWTRRSVTRGGLALYAPEGVCQCPEFVMATLPELAEHGIVGSAHVLPVPVGPEPLALSGPICSQAEARAAGLDIAPSVEELDAMASTIVAAGDPLSAEVSLAQAVPLLGAAVTGLRARVAELEQQLAAKDRPADEDPIAYALTDKATAPMPAPQREASPRQERLRDLLAAQRAMVLEDPHDSPLHHDYLKGRDLPEVQ